jgi:hypothetical protein
MRRGSVARVKTRSQPKVPVRGFSSAVVDGVRETTGQYCSLFLCINHAYMRDITGRDSSEALVAERPVALPP